MSVIIESSGATMIPKPDFSSAVTKVAPDSLFQYGGTNASNTWTPVLNSGVDYLLDVTAGTALYTISIKGGRHVGIIGGHLTQVDLGGPSVYISGGDDQRIIWFEGVLIDDYGFGESDGLRTHNAGITAGTTIIAMKQCHIGLIRGQSNPQFGFSTTLNGAITNVATALTLTSATGAPSAPFVIKIGNEVIGVGARSGTSCTSLTRGMKDTNGPTTAAAHANLDPIDFTNDYGDPTSGTHSDGVQLANGAYAFYAEDCTFQGRYSNLQLQREQSETGSLKTITNMVSLGAIGPGGRYYARVDCTAHGLLANSVDCAQIGASSGSGGVNVSPSGWNGTYHVVNVPNLNQVDIDFGVVVPPASYTSGTVSALMKSTYGYFVGEVFLNRVNFRSQYNYQQYFSQNPEWSLNFYRIAGRPDAKAFADRTPLAEENGPFTFRSVYFDMNGNPDSPGNQCNPGSASTIYPTAKAIVSGSAPNRTVTYPAAWTAFTGQLTEGTPPGGDYCPRHGLVGLNYPQIYLSGKAG